MSTSDDLYRLSTSAGSMSTALKSLAENDSFSKLSNMSSKLANMSTFMAGLGGAFGVASAAFALMNPGDSDTAKILKAISETQQLLRNQTTVITSSIKRLEDRIALEIEGESVKESIRFLDGLLDEVRLLEDPVEGANARRRVANYAADVESLVKVNSAFSNIYDRFDRLRIDNAKSYFESLRDETDGNVDVICRASYTLIYYAMMAKFLYEVLWSFSGYHYDTVKEKSMGFYDKIRNMADVSMIILRDIERNLEYYINKRFVRSYNEFVEKGGDNEQFATHLLKDLSDNYQFLDFVVGVYDKSNGYDNHCIYARLPHIITWSEQRPKLEDTLDSRNHNVFVTWTEKSEMALKEVRHWTQQDRDNYMKEMNRRSQLINQGNSLFSQIATQTLRSLGQATGMLPVGTYSNDWTMQKEILYLYIHKIDLNGGEDDDNYEILSENLLGDGTDKKDILPILADLTRDHYHRTINSECLGNLEAMAEMVKEKVPQDAVFYGVNSDDNYLNLSLKYTNPMRVKYAKGTDWGLIAIK